jgi:two-component system chemotaxis response regulator CheB
MPQTRILIVDDSVVMRRSLADALSREPDLLVAGSASSGRIALMKIPLLRPDVVALDIEMPEMDGLETLAAIRKAYPQLTVIILTVPTDRGSAATIEALSLGAKDFVTKPDVSARSSERLQILGAELASKIASCCAAVSLEHRSARALVPTPLSTPPPRTEIRRPAYRVDVVAIAVSTGGPSALMDILSGFPSNFPVPILIVQHMPPAFTTLLVDRLAGKCKISVAEGRSHETLLPGCAWIAPGDFHMAVERDDEAVRIRVHQDPPEHSCRPAADVLFRSVARVYGRHVLAVVMTGMGRDGLKGCEHIREAGGYVLVQDEASSVVWGMPRFVAEAGMADQILPLALLGAEIGERVWRNREGRYALVGGEAVRAATRESR